MLALLAVGLSIGRTKPGGRVIFWLALLSFALTVLHPNQKARCLHSWLPALWLSAGLGMSALVRGRWTARFPSVRPGLAAGVLLMLVGLFAPGFLATPHALEGGPNLERPSILSVMNAYLPKLDSSRKATVLSAVPCRYVVEWTAIERDGNLDRIEDNWFGFAGDGLDNRAGFRRWLTQTDVDTVVFIEAIPGPFWWGESDQPRLHAELLDLMREQARFVKVQTQDFSDLCCRLTIWRR